MQRIVECVPNFSEGRNTERIDAIIRSIRSVAGVELLDVDPGAETNRTVVTFVGNPDDIVEAAFRGIAEAAARIDMRDHKGAHPRMGATDVCPFVPVRGVTMEECVALARRLGERVGRDLGIPVYLYERAASRPERKNLADVRSGEYEGLSSRIGNAFWKPDFGPAEFNERSGATAIGAREFLIAYNVNLNTRSRKLAHAIALDIRETGRRKRDAHGNAVRDERGDFVITPGKLPECKAVGWYIPEYGAAQVSINLTNYHATSLETAFDAVCEEAEKRGLRVTGSEIVGLVPLEAIRLAGVHYLKRQGLSPGVPEAELVHVAVKSLGLDDLTPFDPHQKIIEYRLRRKNLLVDRSIRDFLDEVSTDSHAPGGGSVASLMGALSTALAAMVASLTVGKPSYEGEWEAMKEIGFEAQLLKDTYQTDIDRDAEAFHELFAAMKMRQTTPAEVTARKDALGRATKGAIEVPLAVLERSVRAAELAREVATKGNRSSLSDAGVAALAARACAEGAFQNVLINLPGIEDQEWVQATMLRARSALSKVRSVTEGVAAFVEDSLEEAAHSQKVT